MTFVVDHLTLGLSGASIGSRGNNLVLKYVEDRRSPFSFSRGA